MSGKEGGVGLGAERPAFMESRVLARQIDVLFTSGRAAILSTAATFFEYVELSWINVSKQQVSTLPERTSTVT